MRCSVIYCFQWKSTLRVTNWSVDPINLDTANLYDLEVILRPDGVIPDGKTDAGAGVVKTDLGIGWFFV